MIGFISNLARFFLYLRAEIDADSRKAAFLVYKSYQVYQSFYILLKSYILFFCFFFSFGTDFMIILSILFIEWG